MSHTICAPALTAVHVTGQVRTGHRSALPDPAHFAGDLLELIAHLQPAVVHELMVQDRRLRAADIVWQVEPCILCQADTGRRQGSG